MKRLLLSAILAMFVTAGCVREVGSDSTAAPTAHVALWCWGGGAIPAPHPSPYALASGIDHPCSQQELDVSNYGRSLPEASATLTN